MPVSSYQAALTYRSEDEITETKNFPRVESRSGTDLLLPRHPLAMYRGKTERRDRVDAMTTWASSRRSDGPILLWCLTRHISVHSPPEPMMTTAPRIGHGIRLIRGQDGGGYQDSTGTITERKVHTLPSARATETKPPSSQKVTSTGSPDWIWIRETRYVSAEQACTRASVRIGISDGGFEHVRDADRQSSTRTRQV